MDEIGETIGWDLDFRQLEPGRLQATVAIVAGPRVSAMMIELDRAFHQQGTAPQGRHTFGILEPKVPAIDWCGGTGESDEVLIFNQPNGFDAVSRAGHRGITLSVDSELLIEAGELLGRPITLDARKASMQSCRGRPDLVAALRAKLRSLILEMARRPKAVDESTRNELDFEIAAELVALMTHNRQQIPDTDLRDRSLALRRALALIEEHAAEPISIKEVCRAARTSWSTLDRAFKERFGVSPKRYLTSVRLHGVRRELRSDSRRLRVVDAANRWGFWHMGQFAKDYREQFGELPSQTLTQARSRRGRVQESYGRSPKRWTPTEAIDSSWGADPEKA